VFVAAAFGVAASFTNGALLTPALAQDAPALPIDHSKSNDELPEIETPVTNTPRPFNPHDPIKGRRSRRAGGQLGAVVSARFYAEHQMLIHAVKHSLQLYWAENGEYPKSNDEFMKEIIQANGLPLPELEPEHEYIYVPEQPEVGLQIRLKPSALKPATEATEAVPQPPEMMPVRNVCDPPLPLEEVTPACGTRKTSRKCKLHCRSTPKRHANCTNR
jgi:hypothetical protein